MLWTKCWHCKSDKLKVADGSHMVLECTMCRAIMVGVIANHPNTKQRN